MGNLLTVYRRECSSYFNSPIAYIVIVSFLGAMSFFFFLFFSFFSQTNPDFRPYFEHILPFGFFSFVVIPAITMRLWSEEKKQGTVELLLTLPLKTWEVVLAKFLAGYTVVALALVLTLSVPLSISWTGVLELDWGQVLTGYIGVFLIAGVYISLGACISAFTENQVVAFMVAVVFSALICFMGYPPVIDWADNNLIDGMGRVFGYFGTFFHYQNFAKGLFDWVDVIYVLSMTGLFIIVNNIAVEGRKYS